MFNDRKNVIQLIFILVGFVFIIRLFYLQVIDTSYKFEAQNNVMRRIIEYPYRGLVYDRSGKLLVYNTPVFDLMVITKEMEVKDTAMFCQQLNITLKDFKSTLKKIRTLKEYSPVKPMPFIKQLSIRDYAKIQDYLSDCKGFYIQARTIRSYPQATLPHVLGYIGEINKKQLENQKERYYLQGDYVGLSGLEASYESDLRGKRGVKHVMVNVRGVEKGTFKNGIYDTISIPGENLTTSIDLELQAYGEKLMGNKIGSVVAIEPATGEILAMVSSPFYDPNLLAGRKFSENYNKLFRDELKPLFNRSIMAMYPPGSIFKIAQALVGQQLGVLKPGTVYPCNQSWGPKCHEHPSPQDLKGSLQWSCNPYYFKVFQNIIMQGKVDNKFIDSEMGYKEWRDHIMSFGFGKKVDIDLPNVKSGSVPSTKFYDKWYGEHRWKHSTIRSLDIGQGELLIIPLQMANMAATIANRGFYFTPHVVKQIGTKGKRPEYLEKHFTKVDNKHFESVVDGMEMAVIGGTASIFNRIDGLRVCGKTGTVQNPHGKDHSVFITFAPRENPKIAIAVFVENAGFGAMTAAPIARLMMEKYLNDTITKPNIETYILEKDFMHRKKDSIQ